MLPPISDAIFCSKCLTPTPDLTPFRGAWVPARHATPKFCRACLKSEQWCQRQHEQATEEDHRKAKTSAEVFQAIEQEALRRPLAKLWRKTAPPYSPAPLFTPEALHDATTDMQRGWWKADVPGWRRTNGWSERVD